MKKAKAVFIDTVGWIALVHRHDNLHQRTTQVYRTLGRILRVTTDAVLIETCNAFSKTPLRPLALALMDKIREAKQVGVLEIIHADKKLIEQGWELFKNRMDKEWSLTDCISLVVMENRGITEAITSDHHFEQAGFEKLL